MAQLLTGTRIYGTGTVDTQLFVSGTNSATSTTTGALQVVGGVGIGGNLYVGGTLYGANINGTASTATNADNIKTVLSTSTSVFFPVFVDSNNATAGYEAVYSSSTFTIIPSSGNVGIGVATPTEKLHVAGNYILLKNTADTAAGAVLDSGSTLGQNTQILLRDRGSDKWAIRKNSANNFDIYGSTAGAVALTIFSSTNFVGIGATVIEDVLHVRRDSATTSTGIVIQNRSASGLPEAGIKFITGSLDLADTRYAEISSTGTTSPVLIFKTGGGTAPAERMRITAQGGIAFGGATNYGVGGQILQSNGDAAPTWVSTGSLAAANATTASHIAGGLAGQLHYQTAPGVTSFVSTGTAGNVLVSNGSSSPTYNSTLTLTGGTTSVSTQSGTLQVVGGFGLGGDAYIGGNIVQIGGTHSTLATTYNLINTTATTVNFAGAATTLTMGASGSGTTNVRNNLTVSGNLTVQGTTTIVDSTVTNIADPIITLGGGTGNSAPTADDNKDRGVAFKWVNNGGTTSTGFFGYDDSTGYFTYVQTATITNEVVSGTKGAMDVNLAGGTAMSIVYQSSQDNTAFLAATTSGYLLQTNGTGSAPSWVNASGVSAGSATYADNVRTIAQAASASYYPTFVDSNNASNAYESVYTTSSFSINPATGAVSILGLTTSTANKLQIGQTSVPSTTFTSTTHLRIIGTANTATDEVFITLVRDRNPSIQYAGGAAISLGSYITPTAASAPSSRLTFSLKSSTDNSDVVNVQVMSLLDNGNVGIGTQSPVTLKSATTLQVNGNVKLGNANDRGLLSLGDIASTSANVGIWRGGAGAYNAAGNYLNLGGYDGITFITGNTSIDSQTERVRIDTSGNLLVGDSNGGYGKLTITGSTSTSGVNIWVRNTSDTAGDNVKYAGIQFSVGTDDGSTAIRSYRTNSGADYSSALAFLTKGVGAGATTPTERMRLTANGGIAFGGASNYGSSGFVLKSNGDTAPTWVDPGTLASASATYADQIRTLATGTNASYYPAFVDSNNAANAYELVYTTSSFSINPQSGNVGIGTTSPSVKLHVVGNTYLNGVTTSTGALTVNSTLNAVGKMSVYVPSTNTITFADNTSTAGLVIVGTGDRVRLQLGIGSNVIGPYGAWIQASYDNTGGAIGSEPLLLNPIDGNVGIGTTSTSYKLDVAGSGRFKPAAVNDQGFFVTSAAGAVNHYFDVQLAPGGGAYNYLRFQVGGSDIFTWGSSLSAYTNNLALNSPSGAITLNANGSERLRITSNGGIAFGGSTNYGTSGQMLQSNGDAAPTWVALSSRTVGTSTQVTTVAQTASASYFPTFVDSNNATATAESLYTTSSFVINPSTGFVGFGPAAPASSLQIIGLAQGQTTGALTDAGSMSGIITVADSNNQLSGGGGGIVFGSGATRFAAIKGYTTGGAGSTVGDLMFSTRNAISDTALTERMRILVNGNIGIGTSAPATRLSATATRHGNADGLSAHLNAIQWEVNGQGYTSVVSNIASSSGSYNAGLLVKLGSTDATDKILDLESGGVNRVRVLGNGNVGIGASSPGYPLVVQTNGTSVNPSSSNIALRLQSTQTNYTVGIQFSDNVTNATWITMQGGGFRFTTANPGAVQAMNISGSGNVSIGTTSTTNKFEVAGNAGQLFSVSDSFTGTIFSANDVSGIPSIEVLDTGLVKFAQYSGQVAINTGTVASSTASLSVYGMIYTMGTLGEIRASSEITAYYSSDRRLKENIKLIENPITIIDQIRGVTFDWTDEHMSRRGGEDGYFVRKHDIGVIAQEVQAVLPELVGTREDGYLAVKYEKLVPLLIEAIKSQQKTIDSLVNDLADVKAFINQLKNNQ